MENKTITTIITILIIIIVFLSIGLAQSEIKEYNNQREVQIQKSFYNGTIAGYQQALYEISLKAVNCEPYYIRINNQSIAVSEVRCEK